MVEQIEILYVFGGWATWFAVQLNGNWYNGEHSTAKILSYTTGAYLIFTFDVKHGKIVNFYVGEEYLFSATVGKSNQIRVAKDSETGREVLKVHVKGNLKTFV